MQCVNTVFVYWLKEEADLNCCICVCVCVCVFYRGMKGEGTAWRGCDRLSNAFVGYITTLAVFETAICVASCNVAISGW
jgi:hypothetical protein